MSDNSSVTDSLDEIVRRIVEAVHPDKIILFGSRARAEARGDSDFDLLVIKSGEVHRGQAEESIYRGLCGVTQPVDVVVVSASDAAELADCPYSVVYPALREGKTIYASREPVSKFLGVDHTGRAQGSRSAC